jgi:tRNA modification GTPase
LHQIEFKYDTSRFHSIATPSGAGAIAVIRISGQDAIAIGNSVLNP